jgi:hypothetical protein
MTQNSGPPESAGAWETLRREGRAYWGGRFRRLWAAAAVGLLLGVGGVLLSPTVGTPAVPAVSRPFEAGFWTLCALVCWGSAWLGSDLLSHRRQDNPEPLRQPSPRELHLRLLGRLLPFYRVMGAATGLLLLGYLVRARLGQPFWFVYGPSLRPFLGNRPTSLMGHPRSVSHWAESFAVWGAWAAVFLASGLPYAALAALFSARFRHPRRLVVTPGAVLLGSAVFGILGLGRSFQPGAASMVNPFGAYNTPVDAWFWTLVVPNFTVGITWGFLLLATLASSGSGLADSGGASNYAMACGGATAFFVIATVLTWLAWLAVAYVRHRRSRWIPASEAKDASAAVRPLAG